MDSIENCVALLLADDAVLVDAVKEVGGSIKVAVVNDPWGNAVGLIEGA